MKFLWAAMIGLTATAWTFEGDWSAWDGTRDERETMAVTSPAYSDSDRETGVPRSYELRSLGRHESRWMGTLDGSSPSLADLNGNSLFDWTRLLGRAEAYHIAGDSRTAPYLASDRAPLSRPLAGGEFRCNLVEANRDRGRAEARETGRKHDVSGEPATTGEMDEESEREATATPDDGPDC